MTDQAELQPMPRDVREEFRADLDAFEATERRLLAEERRERASELTARFTGLELTAAR